MRTRVGKLGLAGLNRTRSARLGGVALRRRMATFSDLYDADLSSSSTILGKCVALFALRPFLLCLMLWLRRCGHLKFSVKKSLFMPTLFDSRFLGVEAADTLFRALKNPSYMFP